MPQCLRRSWPTAGYTFELKGQLHVARHFKRLSVASPTYRLLAGSRLVGQTSRSAAGLQTRLAGVGAGPQAESPPHGKPERDYDGCARCDKPPKPARPCIGSRHPDFIARLCRPVGGQTPEPTPRIRDSVDFGWKFFEGDAPSAQESAFARGSWRSLDLPHDWSIESRRTAATSRSANTRRCQLRDI